ncbi:hypothetical protein LTR36_003802 [Oleoguttula mirabilis]|uniref:Uncharacterized protein n=1 Tax=Oleoguttula mirabilis TaxID=1507867 RepID=A0AAV9JIZ1_9PEZI|nr:hypothetical protein LTR36_003802 [Oleoguttula mirabilis]
MHQHPSKTPASMKWPASDLPAKMCALTATPRGQAVEELSLRQTASQLDRDTTIANIVNAYDYSVVPLTPHDLRLRKAVLSHHSTTSFLQARKDIDKAMDEAVKIVIRTRQDNKVFETAFYRYGARWDHKGMVQRNEARRIVMRMRQDKKVFETAFYRYGARWDHKGVVQRNEELQSLVCDGTPLVGKTMPSRQRSAARGARWDHKGMVQRNEELQGLACDESPPVWAIWCTVAPWIGEKRSARDTLHKDEVTLCDRKTLRQWHRHRRRRRGRGRALRLDGRLSAERPSPKTSSSVMAETLRPRRIRFVHSAVRIGKWNPWDYKGAGRQPKQIHPQPRGA